MAAIQLMVLLFLTRLQPSLRPLLLMQPTPNDAPAAVPPAAVNTGPPVQAGLPCRFTQRIPAHLGTDLLALGAEDHYLRIVTALGSTLILLRLQDAMGELAAGKGMQVHRSWWVAYGAVTGIRRDGGRTTLALSNQQEIPVSRTYLAEVRSAFGLKRNG